MSNLYRKINSNIDKDLSISHYVNGKNYIPLWVLVNSISMGDISKFYSNMLQKERDDVARRMKWGLRENQLASCLFFLSTFRNRCAHDERMYSYLSYAYLCNNNYFHYFHINTNNTNNYFAVMIAFKWYLVKRVIMNISSKLKIYLMNCQRIFQLFQLEKIRNIMGIPNNWRRLKTLN